MRTKGADDVIYFFSKERKVESKISFYIITININIDLVNNIFKTLVISG